ARLFQKLARRRCRGILAGINHPARNLQRHFVCAVTVLLNHDDFIAGRERYDVDPVDSFYTVEVVRASVARIYSPVAPDLKHTTIGNPLRFYATPLKLFSTVIALQGCSLFAFNVYIFVAQTSVTSTCGVI